MKASLDTNVIIHLYRAGWKQILFRQFRDSVYVYDQIRRVELENHGQDVLKELDGDIALGKIQLITDEQLRNLGVLKLFYGHVKENKLLYGPGDLGEVYAISLAETLGAYVLVTDDIKQGGPYMSLLQFVDNEIMPFTFVDVLILEYLEGHMDEAQTIKAFNEINIKSSMNWSFRSHLIKFIKRFWRDPYQESERIWMDVFCTANKICAKEKLRRIREWL